MIAITKIIIAFIAVQLSVAETTKSDSKYENSLQYGTILILGESGSGKSTLAQILTGKMGNLFLC